MQLPSRFVAAALIVGCCLLFGEPRRAAASDPLLPAPVPTPLAVSPSAPSPQPTPFPTPNPQATIPSAAPPAAEEVIPVVIAYGDGTNTRVQITRGLMEPVGVPPNQPVTVTLYLASGIPGSPVQVGLFDGGQISPAVPLSTLPLPNPPPAGSVTAVSTDAILVLADQTVQFNFQSGLTLGLYRTLVTIGSKQYLLQFYAVRPRPAPSIPLPNPPPPQ